MSDKQSLHSLQKAQSPSAEARRARAPAAEPTAQLGDALLQELRVHQIELEMQDLPLHPIWQKHLANQESYCSTH